jgi:hypothetical protein
MENHVHQPTAFEQEQVVSEPTEIERIQRRVSDFTVGLKPATAQAALASIQILLSKGLIKVEELDAIISIREEINKGLVEYDTTVKSAQMDMERAQQNLLIEQQAERERVLAEKETQIEDERLLRKSTQDQLENSHNRLAQMEAILKLHGINMDLDGDGVVGLKDGQVADTLSASEQAEVDSIVEGYDANGSPTTESPSGQTSGAFKLARMMNPIEEGANGIKEEDFPITNDPALQEKIEETSEAFRKYEETQDTTPQVAGGLIAGEDTESFLDEVDRVQEVADIDSMTDAEEEESFESEWEDPTLDIGYDDEDTAEEEGKNIFAGNFEPFDDVPPPTEISRREKVLLDPLEASQRSDEINAEIPKPQNVSAPIITGGNAPSITKEHLADGVYVETSEIGENDVVVSQDNIKTIENYEDLVADTNEEEFEEVVIPNRQDLEGMTKKDILGSAGNLSFDIDSKLTKPLMIDSFESQANALIEELTAGDSFESISEETVDGDDDRRDGGYF